MKKLYKGIKSQVLDEHPWALKAKKATSVETWGPTGTQLQELAKATGYGPQVFNEIFNVLFLRLDEGEAKWRKAYKALIVIDFLLRRGDDHCINPVRIGRFGPKIRALAHNFSHLDPTTGRDVGASIRKKAKEILELVEDEDGLRAAREQGTHANDCVGISSGDARFANAGSRARLEERYTVGGGGGGGGEGGAGGPGLFSSSSRKASFHDDWGPADDAPFPGALAVEPQTLTVRKSLDGKVVGVEGRKVPPPSPFHDGSNTRGREGGEGGEGGKGGGLLNPHANVTRRLVAPNPSKRLAAPPGAAATAAASAVPPPHQHDTSSVPLSLDPFVPTGSPALTAVVASPSPPPPPSDPFAPLPPLLPHASSGEREREGEGEGEGKGGRGGEGEGGGEGGGGGGVGFDVGAPKAQSDLQKWTSTLGFDFDSLNLDSNMSPYQPQQRTPSPLSLSSLSLAGGGGGGGQGGGMGHVSMRSMATKQAAPAAAGSWEPF